MLTDEGREFLEKNEIKNYTINSDGMIDVDWYVDITTNQSKFPVKFGRVTGYFDCSHTQLTSLEETPRYVGGNFYCQDNKLTSLHDIHKRVKELNSGGFYCHCNPITSSVLGLLMIKGVKIVFLDNDEVEKILNKYICQGRAGVIGAQQALLDAELDEYAKL